MKIIGITGGVGAGKTQILSYLQEHYNSRVLRADEVAHLLKEPGQHCYDNLISLLGREILLENDYIDNRKMASVIFSDKQMLQKVNALIHPAVKVYILQQIDKEENLGEKDFFFIEAALLIEEHYDEIVDEMWYIHTDAEIREKRLMESRQYSKQKISEIMKGQLSEDTFRRHCQVVITNNGNLEDTYKQINIVMGESKK